LYDYLHQIIIRLRLQYVVELQNGLFKAFNIKEWADGQFY
jgi:hypothetical protein